MIYLYTLVERLKADKRGVTALEYGIIAAATVVAIGAAVSGFSGTLKTIFEGIGTALTGKS